MKWAMDQDTILKHVKTHTFHRVAFAQAYGAGPIGSPAELLDAKKIREIMNKEMVYLLQNKKNRTGSFEPFFDKMVKNAMLKFNWQPPEDRIYRAPKLNLSNPCGEILLGQPQITRLIDGHHRLNALRLMSEMGMGGAPYPLLLHNTQCRHIARELWKLCYPCHRDTPLVLLLGARELNGKKCAQLLLRASNALVSQMVYGYYNERRSIQWWYWLRQLSNQFTDEQNRLRYTEIVTKMLWDAVGPEKGFPLKAEFRTPTVMGLLKDMRANDDYSNMPILADALQDAGFEEQELLNHYRNPNAFFSGGSWIFRKAGLT